MLGRDYCRACPVSWWCCCAGELVRRELVTATLCVDGWREMPGWHAVDVNWIAVDATVYLRQYWVVFESYNGERYSVLEKVE